MRRAAASGFFLRMASVIDRWAAAVERRTSTSMNAELSVAV
jgi:hypothetical protein